MKKILDFVCICGKHIILELIGGQYQNEYYGECKCGKKWILTNISELKNEIK